MGGERGAVERYALGGEQAAVEAGEHRDVRGEFGPDDAGVGVGEARQPVWPELVRGAASDVEIRPSDVRGHRLPAVRFNQFATVALGALR